MLQFMQTLREKVASPTTIHGDHLIQARTEKNVPGVFSRLRSNDLQWFMNKRGTNGDRLLLAC